MVTGFSIVCVFPVELFCLKRDQVNVEKEVDHLSRSTWLNTLLNKNK